MGYSVKWVTENLGITRDMLRYYEDKELLPKSDMRNPTNKYRDYSDEDIELIWDIKLLFGVGFTATEIRSLMHDPEYDFYMAISQKVNELEQKYEETRICLEFAKSVKFSGCIPTTPQVGSTRFDDFLKHVHENFNFYNDSRLAPILKLSDTINSKKPSEWSPDDMERLAAIVENAELMIRVSVLYGMHGYCHVISDMQELEYFSEPVQRVVALLHKYLVEHNTETEYDGKITPQFIAKHMAPFFICGDLAIQFENNFGKDGCLFIAQALAYYGGYDIDDL